MNRTQYISVILPLRLEWEPCYRLPDTAESICVGDRVRVRFGFREYVGAVSAVNMEPEIEESRILPVVCIEKGLERILEEEIELWRSVAEYYMCTVGEVYKAAYPNIKVNLEEAHAAVREKSLRRRERILQSILAKQERVSGRLAKKVAAAEKTREGTKGKAVLLQEIGRLEEELAGIKAAIDAEKGRMTEQPAMTYGPLKNDIRLSISQEKAYKAIQKGFEENRPVLLHGVTGSGKTEIYIRLACDAIGKGRNVLYLVPEIALSRQLEERLAEHFGDRLMTFHSGISAAGKRNIAEAIRSQERNGYVVLGTRSSLFLPHRHLGLIIVDEEHDSSYKQDSPAPRYNGRDTAMMLSVIHSRNKTGGAACNIIMGSATPSLEETFNCRSGKHMLVSLEERYHGSEDAEIELIDTKAEYRKRGMRGSFSIKLIEEIRNTIAKGRQVMILRSRRSWAPVLQCDSCGAIRKCPHCNVSLSLHGNGESAFMTCHYCGYREEHTGRCDRCGGGLKALGAGTQKIEEEAAALFPEARIARLDSDTAQNKAFEKKTIRDFEKGETDILIGTQILSKGFDFSNLSLVAVIAADTLLGMQDFRADEKALQLLGQFRGRCGRRGERGRFIIQTSQPEHPVYQRLAAKGESSADNALLQERMDFNFPPYTRMIELTVKDAFEDRAERMAGKLTERLKRLAETTGPYRPVIDKVADQYIRTLRISLKKDRSIRMIKKNIHKAITDFEKDLRYEGHITINVDPV